MLVKTKGIVINHLKYKESSIITKIYTEKLGLQTYIVNGVRSSKAKNRMAIFQALTMLDLVVYSHEDPSRINRISEMRCRYPFQSIPFDFRKSVVAIFITEILSKTLQGEFKNVELYEFMEKSLMSFDQMQEGFENFHLRFLIKLYKYLGFAPQHGLDLLEQINTLGVVKIPEQEVKELSILLDYLLRTDYHQKITISSKQRSKIIDYLLNYFQLHTANFTVIKSLEVIREMNYS